VRKQKSQNAGQFDAQVKKRRKLDEITRAKEIHREFTMLYAERDKRKGN